MEAAEVATLLRCGGTTATLTPDIVLDCLFYCQVFKVRNMSDCKWLLTCLMAEGLIEGVEDSYSLATTMLLPLLVELRGDRDMLDDDYSLPQSIWEIASSKGFLIWSASSPEKPPMFEEWEGAKRIYVDSNDDVSLLFVDNRFKLPPKCPKLVTLLNLHHLQHLPESFFEHMSGLRVLHISSYGMSSLPSSLSFLHNLRLLILNDCNNLENLSPFILQALEKLEWLDLSGCSFKKMLDETFEHMRNLRHLDLSFTEIISFPSSISSLHNLRFLNLSNTLIISLPSTLSSLRVLKNLSLEGCTKLKTVMPYLQQLTTLEQLDLSNCANLQDIQEAAASFRHILPKL
ncbi:disease resistance protein Roq1-like [Tasmannia lanceolata]|uniref:disease resistance protein Roq1-like n=1 Tax=Tasmannia lanceolata TaxID=3420 RepID=UPI0040632BE3